MSLPLLLAVALGGGAGAAARYMLDLIVSHWTGGGLPWGTFLVNVSGSFGLGLLAGLAARYGICPVLQTALGTGFLGAYTTFSTWMYETLRLIEEGAWLAGLLNVAASLTAGLVAVLAGLLLASFV